MISCRDQLFAYQLFAIEVFVYAGVFFLFLASLFVVILFPPFVNILRKLVSLKIYSSICDTSALVLVANLRSSR